MSMDDNFPQINIILDMKKKKKKKKKNRKKICEKIFLKIDKWEMHRTVGVSSLGQAFFTYHINTIKRPREFASHVSGRYIQP